MGDELGQHLEEAIQEGKTVEDVVGQDVYAFAEEWAEEDRPAWSAKGRAVEYVFALSFGITYAAAAFHLLTWTLFLSVDWIVIPILAIISWPASRLVFTKETPEHPWWRRWLWPIVAVIFLALTWFLKEELRSAYDVLDIAITGNPDGTLFTWPWYATIAAVVAHLAFGRIRK